MKKNLFLFLFILTLFVFMPNRVNAAIELNKIEGIVVEPKAGEHPVFTADFIISNDIDEVKYEDVEIIWRHVQADEEMTSQDVFNSLEAYAPEIKDFDAIVSDLEANGYSLSDDCESYINGYSMEEYDYFVIDGVDELNLEIIGFNAGNKQSDTAVRYNMVVDDEVFSFVLGPFEWDIKTDNDVFRMDQDDVFQANQEYVFSFTLSDDGSFLEGDPNKLLELADLVDVRTKLTINNDIIVDMKDEIIMIPNGHMFRVQKEYKNIVDSLSITEIEENTEYDTTLFADLDYQLPSTIKVLIGDKELKVAEYTYNAITGKLVIPAELITDDLTIIAEAIAISNPNTSDNIMSFVLVSVVSFIGLFGATLYLKKEVK